MRYRWINIVLLGGVLLLLWPSRAAAQVEPITWDITPGFNGAYRAGTWFPLSVTLSNSGPDVRGTLELRFLDGQSSIFSQTVELPHNAKKQLSLSIASEDTQVGLLRADLILRNGDTVVRRERINLNGHDNFMQVIGVISDQGGVLPELADLIPQERGNGSFVRFSSAELPDRGELLQTFSVIFIHAVDTSVWSDAQRDALAIWVSNGGQLVVGGDPLVTRGLGDLLPATFEEAGDRSTLRGLSTDTGWQVRDDAPAVPVLRLTPRADAEVVLRGDGDVPLLVRRWSGLGLITQTAFGLETVRDAGNAANFWPLVLRINVDQSLGWATVRSRGRDVLEQSLELPGLQLPSVLGLLAFLLVYIVTIGPLNYLLLRRLQRREWAYLTIPLLVLLFSGGAYVWGTVGRGSSPTLTELSVVRVLEDGARGQATSLLAVFSPTRRVYELQAGPDALIANLERPWERNGNDLTIEFAESNVSVPELLVDVGGVRTLSAEHNVAVPQLDARSTAAGAVTINNRSDQPIEDVVLLNSSGEALVVDVLQPGEQQVITIDDLGSVELSLSNGANGTLSRETAFRQIRSLLLSQPIEVVNQFDINGNPIEVPANGEFSAVPEPDEQLYVMGWQSQSILPVTLNGQQTTNLGETVYLWPVSKEQ